MSKRLTDYATHYAGKQSNEAMDMVAARPHRAGGGVRGRLAAHGMVKRAQLQRISLAKRKVGPEPRQAPDHVRLGKGGTHVQPEHLNPLP